MKVDFIIRFIGGICAGNLGYTLIKSEYYYSLIPLIIIFICSIYFDLRRVCNGN